jgi:hypothetical protein
VSKIKIFLRSRKKELQLNECRLFDQPTHFSFLKAFRLRSRTADLRVCDYAFLIFRESDGSSTFQTLPLRLGSKIFSRNFVVHVLLVTILALWVAQGVFSGKYARTMTRTPLMHRILILRTMMLEVGEGAVSRPAEGYLEVLGQEAARSRRGARL